MVLRPLPISRRHDYDTCGHVGGLATEAISPAPMTGVLGQDIPTVPDSISDDSPQQPRNDFHRKAHGGINENVHTRNTARLSFLF